MNLRPNGDAKQDDGNKKVEHQKMHFELQPNRVLNLERGPKNSPIIKVHRCQNIENDNKSNESP